MKHILIYTLKADSDLIVQKLSDEYEIIVCHRFEDAMESIRGKVPHLIISDYKALRNAGSAFHHALHNDFIMIDIPVIAIGCFEGDDTQILSIKQKLYTFNIKRYLYIHSENADLQETVERELERWNPHLGSYTHRFVKSFLLFAGSKKYEQRMRIHLTYIMAHYSLSNVAVSDIKFASAILSTTFTTQNYESVVEFYANMRFAQPILQLLRNVHFPKNLEEEILSAVFRLEAHLNASENGREPFPELYGIRPEIIGYLQETYLEKRHVLQSYKDIIPFWEEISNLLLKNPRFGDEEISLYLEAVQECLMLTLVEAHRAYLQIRDESPSFRVLITPLGEPTDTVRCWMERQGGGKADIAFEIDENGAYSITLVPQEVFLSPRESEEPLSPLAKEERLLHDAHGLKRYSAAEYVDDLGGISNIVEELNLLDEIMGDIFNLLDEKNDLGRESTRVGLIKSIHEYRGVLQNNFYEFQAIALTLLKLENLLEELQEHWEIDISKLRRLLLMMFDDLAAWKVRVFERREVEDINYLDSSILSSSYQIEALFLASDQESEEEFEFFLD